MSIDGPPPCHNRKSRLNGTLWGATSAFKHDQIDIEFENGPLTIHAKVAQRRPENATYLLREFGVGDFYRTFRVSDQVDPARISAEFRDGVLYLHLPKSETAKPRKIKVEPAPTEG